MVLKLKSTMPHLNAKLLQNLAPTAFSSLTVMLSCSLCRSFWPFWSSISFPSPFSLQGLYLYFFFLLRIFSSLHFYQLDQFLLTFSSFNLTITCPESPSMSLHERPGHPGIALIIVPIIIQMTRKKFVKKATCI